jgi:dTDP-4-dehydrorhamnose 3,5-epimerase-like enzyme
MSLIKTINFEPLGDARGSLIALEGGKNISFDIKRVYSIFDTKDGVSRGFHAHRNLKQIAICVTGSCRFVLDDGAQKEEVIMDDASKGLLIENLIWREIHDISSDCVLLVLASEYYDEDDYIRHYVQFIKEVTNNA